MTTNSRTLSLRFAATILSLIFLAGGCEIAAEDKKSTGKDKDTASDDTASDAEDAGQTDAAGTDDGATETIDIDAIETNLTIVEKRVGDFGLGTIKNSSSLIMNGYQSRYRYGKFKYTNTQTKTLRCATLAIGIYPDDFTELSVGEFPIFKDETFSEIQKDKSQSKAAAFIIGNLPEEACGDGYTGSTIKTPTHVVWSAYSGKVEVLGFSKDKDDRKTVVLRYTGLKLRSEARDISGSNDGDPDDETVYVDELEISGTLIVDSANLENESSEEPDASPL
jgi:hypothetical protein